jgi:hypothetical protein
MYLASAVITTAEELNADAFFFVTHTFGKDDPLKTNEKLSIFRRVFPDYESIFRSTNKKNPNLSSIVDNLYKKGYTNIIVIVGEDQVDTFQYLTKYNGKPNKYGQLSNVKVISRQETNDPYADEVGPRATEMRDVLKDPSASIKKKFSIWRAAMPRALSDDEVKHYMKISADRMGFSL